MAADVIQRAYPALRFSAECSLGDTGVRHIFMAIATHANVGLLAVSGEPFQRAQTRAVLANLRAEALSVSTF